MISPNTHFKLSDTSLLGGVEIENWLDIPITKDENGNQQKDKVAFVLKYASDKDKLHEGNLVDLTDKYVLVIESLYSISGRIFSLLECNIAMLSIGTKLSDEKGRCWTIKENNLLFGRVQDKELQKRIKDNNWYFYELSLTSDKLMRPDTNSKLKVN